MRNILFGAGQRPLRRQLAITLSIIFGISILVSMLLFNLLFGVQARNLIDQRSQFFMDAMLAVRSYTSKSVNPIIAPLNEGPGVFRPEAVPSYSAQTVFAGLKFMCSPNFGISGTDGSALIRCLDDLLSSL